MGGYPLEDLEETGSKIAPWLVNECALETVCVFSRSSFGCDTGVCKGHP